jgi:hypothetical protein
MKQISNPGVLIPLTWDDNKWEGGEDLDLDHSQFRYIKDFLKTQEKITFGHKKYPLESDGTYVGYSRMITRLLKIDEYFELNSNDFKVVFFVSSNNKKTYVIGFYNSPQIDWSHGRRVKNEIYNTFTFGNIRSKGIDIVRFDNYLPISNGRMFSTISKELKEKDYAYVSSENILTILDEGIKINPDQEDLLLASSRLRKGIS